MKMNNSSRSFMIITIIALIILSAGCISSGNQHARTKSSKPLVFTITITHSYTSTSGASATESHSITYGPFVYTVMDSTTYILFYNAFSSVSSAFYTDNFSRLAGSDPFKAARMLAYCPEFNDEMSFAAECGDCLDFFLLYAYTTPATAILIANSSYAHVVALHDGTVYDQWFTFPYSEYVEYMSEHYTPMEVYLITFYAHRVSITTIVPGVMKDYGTYVIGSQSYVFTRKILPHHEKKVFYSDVTTVYGHVLILGGKEYTLTPVSIGNGVTVFYNSKLGAVVFYPSQ